MPARLPQPRVLPALLSHGDRVRLRASLDNSGNVVDVGRGATVVVSGWCFDASRTVSRVQFILGERCQRVELYGQHRPELVRSMSDANDPRRHRAWSGFTGLLRANVDVGNHTLTLRAKYVGGGTADIPVGVVRVREAKAAGQSAAGATVPSLVRAIRRPATAAASAFAGDLQARCRVAPRPLGQRLLAHLWMVCVRAGLPRLRVWVTYQRAAARVRRSPGFARAGRGIAMSAADESTPVSFVAAERGTEPYSGLPMVWIGGMLPETAYDTAARVEVAYDGVLKVWLPVKPLEPSGTTFDVQLIVETGAQRMTVSLRGADGTTTLYDRYLADIHVRDAEPKLTMLPPKGKTLLRLRYAARLVRSNLKRPSFLSPRQWVRWCKQIVANVYYLLPAPPGRDPVSLWAEPCRPDRSAYDAYVANTRLTPRRRAAYESTLVGFRYRPTFSVVMPVYNVEVCWIQAAVESVRAQVYPHWELCLADDASTKPELHEYLQSLTSDPRIKVTFRPRNGHICHASNSAAAQASGEFICFMDNDDFLEPDALYHYAKLLQQHADADLIYSDEDKVDATGRRYDPQFKPDWSPELFLSYNYVNHFTCMRRSLFEAAGRFRPGTEGGQDYDLLLRAIESTDRVHHIPRVLYHWRSLPTSTAAVAAVKPVMFTSVERGLTDHLSRTGVPATTYQPPVAERLKLPIHQLEFADEGPAVAVVVPVADDAPLDPLCLASVVEETSYKTFRVTVLDRTTNGLPPQAGIDMVRAAGVSHSEALDNFVAGATAEYVCFVAPTYEVRQPRWLSRLVGYANLPGVGCVGGRVIDAQGVVRDAGVVLNQYDETAPARAFAGLAPEAVSYYFQAEVARNVAAVAGDCMLVRRKTFLAVGGFDAATFPDSLAAVDMCRRFERAGLRNVQVAGAEFRDHGPEPARDDPRAVLALARKYGTERDRYYNPNLSHRFGFAPATACPHAPELPPGGPRRVLFAAHNLNAAEGAPRYLFDIADGLQKRGRVAACVFSPMDGPGRTLYDEAGIPVHVGDMPHAHLFLAAKWQAKEYAATVEYATKVVRELKPEVVVANTLCNFPLVEAAHRAGVPSVWIIHESYTPAQMRVLHTPYALVRCLAAFTLADRVLIASHDTARLFDYADRRHSVEVIHNGLEAAAIEEYIRNVSCEEAKRLVPGPAGRKRIVAVGTVCERKGQHTLVEAAALLRRRGRTDFCIYLVGVRETSLSYLNYVKAIIEREKLHDYVRLIPETNDVRPYWRSSDVFVCASHVEAFSRSMLEAEAFGLPVVTTPCCGANEQVVWGRNALRFEMGDSRQLAAHLERLLADDELRHKMGACSRAVYECHLTNDDMLERYERLILNVWLHAEGQDLPAAVKQAA